MSSGEEEGVRAGKRRSSLSVEHRAAISRALKGRKKPAGFMGDVHKAKIKATQRSKKKPKAFMTEEHRKKISESMRLAWKRRKAEQARAALISSGWEEEEEVDDGESAGEGGAMESIATDPAASGHEETQEED